MAVEVAGTSLHWSHPPLPPFTSLSHKTLPFPFSITVPNRSIPHLTVHRSCFLGAAVVIHRSHQIGGRRRRAPASSSASLDGFGFVDDGEDEFVKRINDLISPKFKTEAEPRMKQDEETSESDLPSVSSSEIRSMRPSCFDLPLSLQILKQNNKNKKKKKKRRESTETTDSACSSVKKAFSSMVFIVRELQIHSIRMRESLFSSSNLQIQGILARVLDELHSSFVWLFQRIFSTTPTLMLSLMLLLANFTIFSISDLPPAADAKPPPQSLSAAVQESQNPNPRFDSSALKSLSVGRSSAGGGAGGGGKNAQAIAGAADDGRWDRWSSSFHEGGTIAAEVASSDEKAWKGIAEEAERIRARGRHEALLDSDTLRRFVSPVTVELEPDDLSAYADTELSYRRALAEGLDDPLILSNFAQFLYVVLRDHDGAEEYFKRAILAKPADPEVLSRYANFLWVGRKDLGAAEETFLEAIEADPGNTYHSANYAHFLWSTGGEDTCYPPDACDS